MKAYLSFNMDSEFDRERYQDMLNSNRYKSFIEDFTVVLRSLYKYEGYGDIKCIDGKVDVSELRELFGRMYGEAMRDE